MAAAVLVGRADEAGVPGGCVDLSALWPTPISRRLHAPFELTLECFEQSADLSPLILRPSGRDARARVEREDG